MRNKIISHPIIFTTVIAVIILLIPLVSTILSNTKSSTVIFHLAPSTATVEFKHQRYSSNSPINLTPGTYTATVSAPGFESKEISFTLTKNSNVTVRTFLVSPDSGFLPYESNYDALYTLREIAASDSAPSDLTEFLTKYDQKLTIVDRLPVTHNLDVISDPGSFYIFNGSNLPQCQRIFCLEIGAGTNSGFTDAEDLIKSWGYNPSDYQIIKSQK
ncbi:hypothetical protein IJI72_01960 [Candidatus Saccharibacteria bacterium]|nr:hypothetical protein [Candidatus Saccharibacteria bacterium]